jgi:hypothetical protein
MNEAKRRGVRTEPPRRRRRGFGAERDDFSGSPRGARRAEPEMSPDGAGSAQRCELESQ